MSTKINSFKEKSKFESVEREHNTTMRTSLRMGRMICNGINFQKPQNFPTKVTQVKTKSPRI